MRGEREQYKRGSDPSPTLSCLKFSEFAGVSVRLAVKAASDVVLS